MEPAPDKDKSRILKPFTLTQVSDQGTSNPIVARLKVGLLELIQMAQLPVEKRDALKVLCYEVGNALVLGEKAALPLMQEIREIEARLRVKGVRVQNERVVEIPGVLRLDDARVFLKYAKQALQTLAKAMGLLLEKDFKGPHFDKVRDHAIQKLGSKHIVSQLLIEDQVWIKEIVDSRNEEEHPGSEKPFVRGFDLEVLADGKCVLQAPLFFNDSPVLNRLEVYSHNLLTFSEEMIAHSLATFFPPMVQIEEIPVDQRDPQCPKRFSLGMKQESGA